MAVHGQQRAVFGLGADNEAEDIIDLEVAEDTSLPANSVDSGQIVAGAVDKTHLSGGFLKVFSADGADETTPPGEIYATVGTAAGDQLAAALFVSTKASVATIEVLDPADFTVGADTITSLDETDRTNDQLLFFVLDLT